MNEVLTSPQKPEWQAAKLKEKEIYQLVEGPTGKKVGKFNWVFKVVLYRDGQVENFKARVVANDDEVVGV